MPPPRYANEKDTCQNTVCREDQDAIQFLDPLTSIRTAISQLQGLDPGERPHLIVLFISRLTDLAGLKGLVAKTTGLGMVVFCSYAFSVLFFFSFFLFFFFFVFVGAGEAENFFFFRGCFLGTISP
jgi:hypothetical protein